MPRPRRRVRALPPSKRWEETALVMWKNWVNVPRLLAEDLGYDKVSKFITAVSKQDADYDVPAALRALKTKRRDATTAMEVGVSFNLNSMPRFRYKVVVATPRRATVEMYTCVQCEFAERYGLLDRKNRTRKIDYPGTDIGWWSHLAELVDPNLKAKVEKLMCWGDDCTRITIYDARFAQLDPPASAARGLRSSSAAT